MSFAKHLQAGGQIWHNHTNAFGPATVIVTTESISILKEQAEFAANSTFNRQIGPRFITNYRDVAQNTGSLEDLVENEWALQQADRIMLSAMSSLRLQLMTRVTLGNCCSNFFLLIKDLLSEGCGSSKANTLQCLQDHPNPKFRVCCSWDKTPECLNRRVDNQIQSFRPS